MTENITGLVEGLKTHAWDDCGEREPPESHIALQAATALTTLSRQVEERDALLRAVVDNLPDEIDLFRLVRGAGRTNIAKARAVATVLEPMRSTIDATLSQEEGVGNG